MGPQHDSCGRAGRRARPLRAGALQWGRNMIVAEGGSVGAAARCGKLQWGRNMIVAEGSSRRRARPPRRDTSMGPQHDSCGRSSVRVTTATFKPTSMGPQHDSCGRNNTGATIYLQTGLQWGRNMIVAEGARRPCQLAHRRRTSMGPQHDSCGRLYLVVRKRLCSLPTSMGPQHDSCGRDSLDHAVDQRGL